MNENKKWLKERLNNHTPNLQAHNDEKWFSK